MAKGFIRVWCGAHQLDLVLKKALGPFSRSVLDHVDNYDRVFATPIETDLRNEKQESILYHGSMVFSLSGGILVRQTSGKGQGVPS